MLRALAIVLCNCQLIGIENEGDEIKAFTFNEVQHAAWRLKHELQDSNDWDNCCDNEQILVVYIVDTRSYSSHISAACAL